MSEVRCINWDEDLSVYEECSPRGYTWKGGLRTVRSWGDLFYTLCMEMYKSDPLSFGNINARFDFEDIFSRKMNSSRGTRGLPLDLANPYLVTRKSTHEILQSIVKLCQWLRIDERQISIMLDRGVRVCPAGNGVKRREGVSRPNPFEKLCHLDRKAEVEEALPEPVSLPEAPEIEFPAEAWRRISLTRRDMFDRYQASFVQKVVFLGKSVVVRTWEEAAFVCCAMLAEHSPETFKRIVKMMAFRGWFAPMKPYREMVRPKFLEGLRVWMESRHQPRDILEAVVTMMLYMDIRPENMEIWVVVE